MIINNRIKAYTLVEILVVVTLFALLGTIGAGLFSTTLRGSSKANIMNEVKQNGEYTLGIMERYIRNADEIDTFSVTCSTTGSSNLILTLKNFDGTTTRFWQGGANRLNITIYGVGSPVPTPANYKLTNDLVIVGGHINFVCISDTNNKPSTIKISFTLQQKATTGPVDQSSSILFETTVAVRNK